MTDTHSDLTPLDQAHAAMEDDPTNDVARLKFFEQLADTELFLLLAGDPDGNTVQPELFDSEDQKFALVFDREDRLASFVGRPVPYAELPCRGLLQMLEGQAIGFALNLEVAPSAMLIPADAVDWLVGTLCHAPEETEAKLQNLDAPKAMPDAVLDGLARKLSAAAGLATTAFLAAATYEDGASGHLLLFLDAVDGAEKPLANTAGEALTFSGIETGILDVLFAKTGDPIVARFNEVGLRFDLPELSTPESPAAPGMDPEKPPKLR